MFKVGDFVQSTTCPNMQGIVTEVLTDKYVIVHVASKYGEKNIMFMVNNLRKVECK